MNRVPWSKHQRGELRRCFTWVRHRNPTWHEDRDDFVDRGAALLRLSMEGDGWPEYERQLCNLFDRFNREPAPGASPVVAGALGDREASPEPEVDWRAMPEAHTDSTALISPAPALTWSSAVAQAASCLEGPGPGREDMADVVTHLPPDPNLDPLGFKEYVEALELARSRRLERRRRGAVFERGREWIHIGGRWLTPAVDGFAGKNRGKKGLR